MNIPIDSLIDKIQNSEDCRSYLSTTYPYEYEIWTRFSAKNGNSCAFARAALKQIFNKELHTEAKCLIQMLLIK